VRRQHKTLLGQLRRLAAHKEAVVHWHNGLSRETQWEWASPGAVEKHCPDLAPPEQRADRRADNRARQARQAQRVSPRGSGQARDLEQANARIAELEEELTEERAQLAANRQVLAGLGQTEAATGLSLEQQIEQLCVRVLDLPTAEQVSAAWVIYRRIIPWLEQGDHLDREHRRHQPSNE
jgi:hypothetical protein